MSGAKLRGDAPHLATAGRPIDQFPDHVPEPPASPAAAEGALDGLLVLDFTHFVAGPVCSLLLADLGSQVIKIESTRRGDEFRYYPPFPDELNGEGAAFLWANRNKQSVALDLKSSEGLALARELIGKADVLIENFSTGTMDRLGLGYADCAALNPRLVYCSVTAYGKTGPMSHRKGHDPIAQAESGFMSLNGYADRDGVRTGPVIMDVSSGLFAASAILAALHKRTRTGRGQEVEVALFDTAVSMLGYTSVQYLMSGKQPGRYGNSSLDTCPTGIFTCSDTSFYLSCTSDRIFDKLARQVIRQPEWLADPRFATAKARLAHRELLMSSLNEIFGFQPWAHWESALREAGVPAGEYRGIEQSLHSKEAAARALVSRIPDPTLGWSPYIRLPIRMSDACPADPQPAPRRGEHTRQVLAQQLGLSPERIEHLLLSGAVEGR